MALLSTLLLAIASVASAQPRVLAPGRAFSPAGSVAVVSPSQVGAVAADIQGAAVLKAYGEMAPLRFREMNPRGREAVLKGLESIARAEKDNGSRLLLQRLVVEDELEHIEPRLRSIESTAERRDDVVAKTQFRDVRWYHRYDTTVDPDGTGIPEGRAWPDGRIGMFIKKGWRKAPDFTGHVRVLFAHEYTHRLQFENVFSFRGEPPAVATELLRGIELFGLEGLQGGMIDWIGSGVLGSFDHGRKWAAQDKKDKDNFYTRGFLAGAAYEFAVRTGNWEDAWFFHRLVSSGMEPAQAATVIKLGSK